MSPWAGVLDAVTQRSQLAIVLETATDFMHPMVRISQQPLFRAPDRTRYYRRCEKLIRFKHIPAPYKYELFPVNSPISLDQSSIIVRWAGQGTHQPWTAFPPLVVDPLALELGHPTFLEIRFHERNLPQHVKPNLLLEGPDPPRSDHAHMDSTRTERDLGMLFLLSLKRQSLMGVRWNNFLQQYLLNTHLAYLSQRAYVFSDYISSDHPPFPDKLSTGARHQLHIPMNAFIAGATAGSALSADGSDNLARRAVSEEWWDLVCPPSQRITLGFHQTMWELGLDEFSEAHDTMFLWARKLLEMKAPCVKIEGGAPWNFNYPNIISLWPSYSTSPALTAFAWSPLITAALFRNFHFLSPNSPPPSVFPITTKPYRFRSFSPYHPSTPPIKGLLGVHIRRGDFEHHCSGLADIGLEYNAWNQLGAPGITTRPTQYNSSLPPGFTWPILPDYLDASRGQSRRSAILTHCWPTTDSMLSRINSIRDEAAAGKSFPPQTLRRIYMATDGSAGWVESMTELLRADGWEVSSSLDIDLSFEEYAVSQAVDMAFLTAAESFIGAGPREDTLERFTSGDATLKKTFAD
ncbi:SH3 and PX-domain-containing 3 [Favolaschia claudopus]|uniref:SH3 and PX-domain-containing 3 n=1 Tax=Favolaschia claudopus TaxID=2862362 RepID=A0AAW0CLU6_9AGAR